MLPVYDTIMHHHDINVVLLAGTICVLSSFVALSLLDRARTASAQRRSIWLIGAAFVAGSGVWATHFMCMLALRTELFMSFDLGLTALSIVIAVTMAGVGLACVLVYRRPLLGGAILGAGIALMHYIGMAALLVDATKHWNLELVFASSAIAIFLGALALWLIRNQTSLDRRLPAVLVLTLAICGAHFTGMAALTLRPGASIHAPNGIVAPDNLAVLIAIVATLIAALGFAGGVIGERAALKAAERTAKLAASERRTMRFFELMNDLVLIIRPAGVIMNANPRSFDLIGVDASLLLGRPLMDFVASRDIERVTDILGRIKNEAPTAEFEAAINGFNDQEIPLYWSVTLSAEDGTLMIVARDLRSRQAREQLATRHRKLEALAAFAGGFAHEFNSLVTVILGEAEFVAKDALVAAPIRKRGQLIVESAERAAGLAKNLLGFARKSDVATAILDVDRAVQRACALLKPFLFDATIEQELNAHNALVRLDQQSFASVVEAIFANANDAVRGKKGAIRIATALVHGGTAVEIVVSDNGIGMTPETIERAFDPFFTTKEPGGGSGLGLSSVYGIIASAGGDVTISSELGAGTSVTITLPLLIDNQSLPDLMTTLSHAANS